MKADLGEVMTILTVTTKGRGVGENDQQDYQWVTLYKLATVVNGHHTYYKGPLNGMVNKVLKFGIAFTCRLLLEQNYDAHHNCINNILSSPQIEGNTDRITESRHDLSPPIKGRYIRLYPIAWAIHPTLHWELFGQASNNNI